MITIIKPIVANGLAIAILMSATNIMVSGTERIRFHNEAKDTIRINEILATEWGRPDAGNVERIARLFDGAPYQGGTLEGDEELLTVDLDEFDCTTFVETVLALAYTASEHRRSWRDFTDNLERMRYRNGHNSGYASRLHYPGEWVVDNASRGLLKDVTADIPMARYNVKSLNFMSSNASLYPALADSTNLSELKKAEAGLSNHRYPIVKYTQVKDKYLMPYLKAGDIVLITTSKKGLDVSHMGIIVFEHGKPYLLHASSKHGKVTIDPLSLEDYFRRNRPEGLRIIRLMTD